MDDFRKEYLGSGITAFVSQAHSFGTDAVLLADFASPSKKAVCCDLGSGCGIIPLLWCKKETKSQPLKFNPSVQNKSKKQLNSTRFREGSPPCMPI